MNIFFDLDGARTDSRKGIARCIQHAMTQLKYQPASTEDLAKYIGPPLHDSFANLLNTNNDNLIREAMEIYRIRFAATGMFENKVYDDITDVLTQLANAGYMLYVVTSKPTIYAKRIIEHFALNSYFINVYGSELDGTFTNKTELIRHILAIENITPDNTIMIGDREHDIIGAKENHIQTIAVTWGYGSTAELKTANPDILCDSPRNLPNAIANLQHPTNT